MTTDEQVRRLMSLIKKYLPLATAAVKAARKYQRDLQSLRAERANG